MYEPHNNPEVVHEESDVNVRAILGFGAALFAVGVVIHLLLWLLFNFYTKQAAQVLSKREPWKTLCASSGAETDPAEVLRTRYQNALKAKTPRVAEHLYAREQAGDRKLGTYASALKGVAGKRRRPYV